MIFKNSRIMIAGLCFTAASASLLPSQASGKSSEKAEHSHHNGYVKPGAAIDLIHDYDGQTAAGEREDITVTLRHIYSDGTLTVRVLQPSELQVVTNFSEQTHPIERGSTLALPLRFSGIQMGAFSIGIEVVYESVSGHQSRRVLSVPIIIGSQPVEKRTQQATKQTSSTRGGMIALPATETIR